MASLDEVKRLRAALQANPQHFVAWVMLADAEMNNGNAQAGVRAAERALHLRPRHPEALARLGRAFWMQKRYKPAVEALREAGSQVPDHAGIALWLGHALEDAGDAEGALDAYRHAHRLLPREPYIAAQLLNWRRKLCDWQDLDVLSEMVREAIAGKRGIIEPFAFLSEEASAAEQSICAQSRAAAVTARIPFATRTPRQTALRTELRLGFLSNGFGAHPTGLLTAAFFEMLRLQTGVRIHIFASNTSDGSPIERRLGTAAHQFQRVAGWGHSEIGACIRHAELDILYDLRGWGGGGVPEVLATRPAPIQVNWLAYPGTSGAPWIDYILADAFVLPEAIEKDFSEKVIRLPRCFQPSDTTRTLDPPPPRRECGLPEKAVVFCCFNNSYKLNPKSFEKMLTILFAVPESVLWLLSGPGKADGRLRSTAERRGLDPARLIFMPKLPHPDYLSRFQYADLFLDTSPYNAHTTASDALWAGCPVLTQPGQTFAARVAGSLNAHLGLDEMNAENDAAYIARAVQVGNDATYRLALRQKLEQSKLSSTLFDMPGFARDFVATARVMVAGAAAR